MSVFLVVKFIHTFAAIVAVGMNISYGIWIIRAQQAAPHTAFTLKGIKFISN